MLAAGVATCIGAVVLGEVDLLRVAIAIILLVLVCWAWLGLCGLRMHSAYRVGGVETPMDSPIEVEISLTTRSTLPLLTLECTDRIDDDLGAGSTLVVSAGAARAGVTLRYTCAPRTRGWHRIGPLTVTATDPFGLATTTSTGAEHVDILALPIVEDLGSTWATRRFDAASGTRATQMAHADTHLDASLRDHEQHDGLRRVHWRSSARQGKLMVRQDEQRSRRQATILIDDRDPVHDGATFDQMISVAASVGVHLLKSGYELASYTSDGFVAPGYGAWTSDGWLRTLAIADTSATATLDRLAETPDPNHVDGPVWLLLTAASAPGPALLRRAANTNIQATAVVVEPPSGGTPADILRALSSHGWQVVVVAPGGSLTSGLAAMDRPR